MSTMSSETEIALENSVDMPVKETGKLKNVGKATAGTSGAFVNSSDFSNVSEMDKVEADATVCTDAAVSKDNLTINAHKLKRKRNSSDYKNMYHSDPGSKTKKLADGSDMKKQQRLSKSENYICSPESKGTLENSMWHGAISSSASLTKDGKGKELTFVENSVRENTGNDLVLKFDVNKNPNKSSMSGGKKVRNPYGRKGKPGKAGKKLKVNSALQTTNSSLLSCPSAKVDRDRVKPEWLKPFKEGWFREIVYRNSGPSTGRKCDIYYFTPSNMKLRSGPQIAAYLSKVTTDLTVECFTFVKYRVYEEPAEYVRTAGLCGKRAALPPQLNLKKLHKGKPNKSLKKPSIKLKLKKKKCINMLSRTEILPAQSATGDFSLADSAVAEVKGERPCPSTPAVSSASPEVVEALALPETNKSFKLKLKLKNPKCQMKLNACDKACEEPLVDSAKTKNLCDLEMVSTESPKIVDAAESQKQDPITASTNALSPTVPVEEEKSSLPSQDLEDLSRKETERDGQRLSQNLHLSTVQEAVTCEEIKKMDKKKSVSKNVAKKSLMKVPLKPGPMKGRTKCKEEQTITSQLECPYIETSESSDSGPVFDVRLCGLHCARQFGMAPSLHCDICMCMFHPECVGLAHVPHRTSFTCKACRTVNEDLHISPTLDDSIEPNYLSNDYRSITTPSIMNQWSMSDTLFQSPVNCMTYPLLSSPQILIDRAVKSVDGVELVSPASMNANRPTGRVLTLPLSLTLNLDLSLPIKLNLNGWEYVVPTDCFLLTESGLRVILPNKLFPTLPANSAAASQNVTQNVNQVSRFSLMPRNLNVYPADDSLLMSSSTSLNNSHSNHQNGSREFERSRDTGGIQSEVENLAVVEQESESVDGVHFIPSNGGNPDFEENGDQFCGVFGRADLLLHIFKFLTVPNLLRVKQVCHLWKKATEDFCLWKNVNFDGIMVFDWNQAAQLFTANNTESLDLTRLIHCGSENQTWHQLTSIFCNLVTVRHLTLGLCPPNLLYCAAAKMAQLESLRAIHITDAVHEIQTTKKRLSYTKFDAGKLAVLKNLVRLEIHGVHGLTLPAFSFTEGLAELRQLSELKHLSLTSLRDVPGNEFSFLGHLEKLEILEIGDCQLWTKETYSQLGQLTNLHKLRLENGSDTSAINLGAILEKLKRLEHLELFRFILAKNSAEQLASMNHIKTLHLRLDACQQTSHSNFCLLSAIQKMTFLKELTWTVLNSDVPTQSVEDCEDCNNCCVNSILFSSHSMEEEQETDSEMSSTVEWKSIADVESILKESLASTAVHVSSVLG